MKLEDQVCTIEQAKKLKELGVAQVSLFFHRKYQYTKHKLRHNGNRPTPTQTIFNDIGYGSELHGDYVMTESHSAFTVAELGVMMGEYWEQEITAAYDFTADTEAEERAHYLIGAIESGQLKVDFVNNCLEKNKR